MTAAVAYRTVYRKPTSDEAVAAHDQVRACVAAAMDVILVHVPEGRERSLALTKLEEAMFWGNAGVARKLGSEGGATAADSNL